MGDFSINVSNKAVEFDRLDECCDLTNLVTLGTCLTKTHKSTLDLILTLFVPCISEIYIKIKIYLNFCFNTSL